MYFILIPFFLAVNVLVFEADMKDWKFGPEYTYKLTMNYAIKTDTHDLVTDMRLTSTVKCRPKDLDILFCHLQNSTTMVSHLSDRNMTREIETEKTFAIKFNERGVESLLMETPFPIQVVTIVRKIANQLSVGVDLNERKISMSQFVARENTSMGDCATRYRIERKESQSNDEEKDTEWIANSGYWTQVLSMTDARPSDTVFIEKSRMGCVNTPRYLDYATGILKMGRFFSKIQIGDRFKTFSEIDGKLRPANDASKIFLSEERIHLNLESIEPAFDELPSVFQGELIDLNINNDVPNNFVD